MDRKYLEPGKAQPRLTELIPIKIRGRCSSTHVDVAYELKPCPITTSCKRKFGDSQVDATRFPNWNKAQKQNYLLSKVSNHSWLQRHVIRNNYQWLHQHNKLKIKTSLCKTLCVKTQENACSISDQISRYKTAADQVGGHISFYEGLKIDNFFLTPSFFLTKNYKSLSNSLSLNMLAPSNTDLTNNNWHHDKNTTGVNNDVIRTLTNLDLLQPSLVLCTRTITNHAVICTRTPSGVVALKGSTEILRSTVVSRMLNRSIFLKFLKTTIIIHTNGATPMSTLKKQIA